MLKIIDHCIEHFNNHSFHRLFSDYNWSFWYPGQPNIYIHPLKVGGTEILRSTPDSPHHY